MYFNPLTGMAMVAQWCLLCGWGSVAIIPMFVSQISGRQECKSEFKTA
jgi:hypothetical protein